MNVIRIATAMMDCGDKKLFNGMVNIFLKPSLVDFWCLYTF
jgi:hypothetical protein